MAGGGIGLYDQKVSPQLVQLLVCIEAPACWKSLYSTKKECTCSDGVQ